MKNTIIILLITIFMTFGCTRVPNSVETGVLPGEYDKLLDSKELLKEKEALSLDLEETIKAMEKLQEEYSNLKQSNGEIIKELEEANSLLSILQNEELPKITLEKTDIESIINYLKEVKIVLSDSSKDIEIIELGTNKKNVLFVMVGYNNHNQLFVWKEGQKEPSKIEGAYYNKDGNYKWLLEDKYLIIHKGNSENNENIIIDIEKLMVINVFEAVYKDIYLIPDTSSIIMKKNEIDSIYIIFDFINNVEKEIVFDFKNNNLELEVKNDEIKFSGDYKDSHGIEYIVKATISVDKFKEKYEIKSDENSTDTEDGGEDTV